jgi:hypothetical protein
MTLALAATAATITVGVSPCLVTKGTPCTIEWTSTGTMAAKVNVSVRLGTVVVQQYLNRDNSPGSNEIAWSVPSSLLTGEYTFRVVTTDNLVQGEWKSEIRDRGIYTDGGSYSSTYVLGSKMNFGWRGWGLPYSSGAYFDLYRSGVLVGPIGADAMNSSHGCGRSASWVVGELHDPDTDTPLPEKAPMGSDYRIRIRTHDGAYYSEIGPFAITVQIHPGAFNRHKHIARIPVWPVPGCPMCGEVQLQELWQIIESSPEVQEVQLWHGGRMLAKLAERGVAARRLSGRRVEFGGSFALLQKGGAGFELRLLGASGKLLGTQAVVLNLKSK